jgi:hypothetical protein
MLAKFSNCLPLSLKKRMGVDHMCCSTYYAQKVDMCSECPKSPIVNARAWLDSA